MSPVPRTREEAEQADTADPLGSFRDRFAIPDEAIVYLDGNSLGRPPKAALKRIRTVAEAEWADGLVRSWGHWIDLPRQAGDRLAPLMGADPGEVVLGDQTSVNLYKLAMAAVAARPDATAIVTEDTNFPSDRYVLEGVADAAGLELRVVTADPATGITAATLVPALDDRVALVSLSHTAYQSAAVADLAGVTAAAHARGALVLWDLSHSVGAVPVDLGAAGADLAVGCTYKYLNGGPGAPAFLYVRVDLQGELLQPIRGWFGHEDMFAFADDYRPAPGMDRFTVGTPPIVSLAAAEAGIELTAEAGIAAIRAKSVDLTELMIGKIDGWPRELGFTLASPRDAARRGGHVAVRHKEAARITAALGERAVVADFRSPDSIRLAPSPLYTRFVDVWDGMEAVRDVAASGAFRELPTERSRVT